MARRGRGSASFARRQQAPATSEAPVTGTLRPLIPFYVPENAEGAGNVNTELRSYGAGTCNGASRSPSGGAPAKADQGAAVPVRVRRWDARQGIFGPEAVHYVHHTALETMFDHRHASVAEQPVSVNMPIERAPTRSAPTLLTPEIILQNREMRNNDIGNSQHLHSSAQDTGPEYGTARRPPEQNSLSVHLRGDNTTATPRAIQRQRGRPVDESEKLYLQMPGQLAENRAALPHAQQSTRTVASKPQLTKGKHRPHSSDHTRYAGASYSSTTPAPQAVPVPQFATRYLANQSGFMQEPGPHSGNQAPHSEMSRYHPPHANAPLQPMTGANHAVLDPNYVVWGVPLNVEDANVHGIRRPTPLAHAQAPARAQAVPSREPAAPAVSALELYRNLGTGNSIRSVSPGMVPETIGPKTASAEAWPAQILPMPPQAPPAPTQWQTSADPVSEQLRRVLNLPAP
jgi:hypothetical protein